MKIYACEIHVMLLCSMYESVRQNLIKRNLVKQTLKILLKRFFLYYVSYCSMLTGHCNRYF